MQSSLCYIEDFMHSSIPSLALLLNYFSKVADLNEILRLLGVNQQDASALHQYAQMASNATRSSDSLDMLDDTHHGQASASSPNLRRKLHEFDNTHRGKSNR